MTQARPVYDRVQGQPVRCWRCERPLQAYTDGNGLTLWSCDRCTTEIRQLRERLRLAESGKAAALQQMRDYMRGYLERQKAS